MFVFSAKSLSGLNARRTFWSLFASQARKAISGSTSTRLARISHVHSLARERSWGIVAPDGQRGDPAQGRIPACGGAAGGQSSVGCVPPSNRGTPPSRSFRSVRHRAARGDTRVGMSSKRLLLLTPGSPSITVSSPLGMRPPEPLGRQWVHFGKRLEGRACDSLGRAVTTRTLSAAQPLRDGLWIGSPFVPGRIFGPKVTTTMLVVAATVVEDFLGAVVVLETQPARSRPAPAPAALPLGTSRSRATTEAALRPLSPFQRLRGPA